MQPPNIPIADFIWYAGTMKEIASHAPEWTGNLIEVTTANDAERKFIPGFVEKVAYLYGPDDQMPDAVIVNGKRFVPDNQE
jgi:hypothetical protein